jgi:1-phosphofructokinase
MIVTLTLNPSIDRTLELARPLARGAVQRTAGATTEVAAGKGVNVARVLAAADVEAHAIVLADPDDRYAALLAADGVDATCVALGSPVRTNIAITEPDGTTTKVNEPGAAPSADTVAAVLRAVRERSAGARWLVVAGSLPVGAAPELVADVVRAARDAEPGIRIAVDTSGAPLAAAVAAGGVDLVKPNDEELEELLGLAHGAIASPADAAIAAEALVGRGVGAVLLTLGGDGAILADPTGTLRAVPPPTVVRSTVGAGDASLAGWLIAEARGDDAADRLAQAVAHGSAAAAMPGTGFPAPADADAARVRILPRPAPAPAGSALAAAAADPQEH